MCVGPSLAGMGFYVGGGPGYLLLYQIVGHRRRRGRVPAGVCLEYGY